MKNFYIFCLLLISNLGKAQNPAFIKFFDSNKFEIADQKQAASVLYYFTDSLLGNSKKFLLKEYFQNGKLKMIGTSYFENEREFFEGQFHYYNEQGKLSEITTFSKGYKLGASYHFYPNRKLKKEIVYEFNFQHDRSLEILENQGTYYESTLARGKLMEYVDSLGNVIISKGNGTIKQMVNYLGEDFVEEGTYENGLKSGQWKLVNLSASKIYLENYKNGELLKGELYYQGKKIKYKQYLKQPILPVFQFLKVKLMPIKTRASAYYHFSYFIYPNGNDNEIYKQVLAKFYLVIDVNNKIIDVEFATLLPKAVSSKLKQEFMASKGYVSAYFRGEPTKVKLPYYLTVFYGKDIVD